MDKISVMPSVTHANSRELCAKSAPTKAALELRCPTTGKTFNVDITASILSKIGNDAAQVGCDHCGGSHMINVKAMFLDQATTFPVRPTAR